VRKGEGEARKKKKSPLKNQLQTITSFSVECGHRGNEFRGGRLAWLGGGVRAQTNLHSRLRLRNLKRPQVHQGRVGAGRERNGGPKFTQKIANIKMRAYEEV